MTPVKELRYSITFRTILDKRNKSLDSRQTPDAIAKRLLALGVHPEEAHNLSEPARQLKFAL